MPSCSHEASGFVLLAFITYHGTTPQWWTGAETSGRCPWQGVVRKNALMQNYVGEIRRLTRLYIAALSTVALLAICGQLVIQFSLIQQAGDANIINIAGRQRMLSQKLTKAALALLVTSQPTTRKGRVDEVRTTLTLWQQSQQGLQQGDARLGLPGNNSKTVTNLFGLIAPNFQAMIDATNQFLATVAQDQGKPVATINADILPSLRTLLAQEPAFLVGMNNIVSQYQQEAEDRVSQLRVIELALLSLTLITLLLEGVLVFRPAIGRLSKSLADLVHAEEQVAARTVDLEQKNTELELAFNEAMAAHRKVMPHARVVTFGHYQVQGIQGNYHEVTSREVNGTLYLVCDCLVYRRNVICSHSLAAAALHSALLRQQSSSRHPGISSPERRGQAGG